MDKKSESGKLVCDGKDEEFTEGFYKICCLSNKGQLPGHFLKIEDNVVIANATRDDEKAIFKIRAVQSDVDELPIMIIENQCNQVMALEHDDNQNRYIITAEKNEQLQEIHRLSDAQVQASNFLFKKVPCERGSEIFKIVSNIEVDGKPLVVAFDENGEPMDPAKNPHDDRAFFRMFSA